jgi:hypothetical protein
MLKTPAADPTSVSVQLLGGLAYGASQAMPSLLLLMLDKQEDAVVSPETGEVPSNGSTYCMLLFSKNTRYERLWVMRIRNDNDCSDQQ